MAGTRGDKGGECTFVNSRGTSLIGYVLKKSNNFSDIKVFKTGVYTLFSDHAPVEFTIKTPPKIGV